MKIGRFSTVTLVLVSAFSLGVLLLLAQGPLPGLFGIGSLADLFGFPSMEITL